MGLFLSVLIFYAHASCIDTQMSLQWQIRATVKEVGLTNKGCTSTICNQLQELNIQVYSCMLIQYINRWAYFRAIMTLPYNFLLSGGLIFRKLW